MLTFEDNPVKALPAQHKITDMLLPRRSATVLACVLIALLAELPATAQRRQQPRPQPAPVLSFFEVPEEKAVEVVAVIGASQQALAA